MPGIDVLLGWDLRRGRRGWIVRPADGAALEIVTERLLLRPFRAGDAAALAAYRSEPDVARYQSWEAPYTPADAERFIASQQDAAFGDPGNWTQIAVVDRVSGALHGDCAVRVSAGQPHTAEVGVTFASASQRRGLASEALGAVVGRLFDQHDLHRIYGEADDRNAAVHRLFERLCFRREARLVEADWFKGEWATLVVFALLRREWAGR